MLLAWLVIIDVYGDHLAEVCLSGRSTGKLLCVLSLFHIVLFGRKFMGGKSLPVLGSLAGALQIRLTKNQINKREKKVYKHVYHAYTCLHMWAPNDE